MKGAPMQTREAAEAAHDGTVDEEMERRAKQLFDADPKPPGPPSPPWGSLPRWVKNIYLRRARDNKTWDEFEKRSAIGGHTRGPWKVAPSIEGDFVGIYPDTGKQEFPIAVMPKYLRDEINTANAHLIAAAPMMLEALRDALDKIYAEFGHLTEEKFPLLRAAIDKAHGNTLTGDSNGQG